MKSFFKDFGRKEKEKEVVEEVKKVKERAFLLPDRHPNRDFFVADICIYVGPWWL